jgi:hypothetical protein
VPPLRHTGIIFHFQMSSFAYIFDFFFNIQKLVYNVYIIYISFILFIASLSKLVSS